MSLRWRLTLLYTLLMVVLLTAISFSVYSLLRSNLYTSLKRETDAGLTQVVKLAEESPTGSPQQSDIPRNVCAQIDNYSVGIFLNTSNNCTPIDVADGHILLTADEFNLLVNTGQFAAEKQVLEGKALMPKWVVGHYRTHVKVSRPSSSDFERIEPVQIQSFEVDQAIFVYRDLSDVLDTLDVLRRVLILVFAFGLIAASLGAYNLAGRVLEPLHDVSDAASEITDRDLSRRVPVPRTGDEVNYLARTLNGMLERLEHAFDGQRQFTADASHELRTPITAILGHANYLLRRTELSEQQRESIGVIRSDAERLTKLVTDLLDLARADAGFQITPKEMDLVALAEDVHLEVAVLTKGSEIEIVGPRNAKLRADPQRMRQVLLNLVTNALKAGANKVTIGIETQAERVLLRVEDDGPGISSEHLAKLFDRFYRVDTARNRTVGGSGLGLAIVKWIVEAHGGTVSVKSQVGKGTRFEVSLPVAGPISEAQVVQPQKNISA